MKNRCRFYFINLLLFIHIFVSCANGINELDSNELPQDSLCTDDRPYNFLNRSRIAWDKSSLVKIFQPGNYARVIEISKDNLVAVSGGPDGVQITFSKDRGNTWSETKIVAPTQKNKITMSVPEIMKCNDGSLLLTYNPRPIQPNDDINLKYGIRAKISKDGGSTWSDEIFVYDAQHTDLNGCWEPFSLQLPSGEIQLYFANENDYPDTNEQNISMCRSFDGGKTWSGRQIVSFRSNHRDGMPVALYLNNTKEIIVAIEDNGYENHKNRMQPSVIRLNEKWDNTTVLATDDRREYALKEHLLSVDNAAAPYICKSPTGEILLSYQGTLGRDVPVLSNGVKSIDKTQEMFVSVGDSTGRNFTNTSSPFLLPLGPNEGDNYGFEGMWNSITSFSTGEIFAVTSTNAYDYPKSGVYGIKGYMLNDIVPLGISASIDGKLLECNDVVPSIVVGHTLNSTVYGYICDSGSNLYLGFKMCGNDIIEYSDIGELKDGFEIILSSTDGDVKKTISVPFNGNIVMDNDKLLPSEFIYQRNTSSTDDLIFECLIPYSYFKELGVKDALYVTVKAFDSNSNGKVLSESLTMTDDNDISTWLKLYIE